jgi:hypothetical protein
MSFLTVFKIKHHLTCVVLSHTYTRYLGWRYLLFVFYLLPPHEIKNEKNPNENVKYEHGMCYRTNLLLCLKYFPRSLMNDIVKEIVNIATQGTM